MYYIPIVNIEKGYILAFNQTNNQIQADLCNDCLYSDLYLTNSNELKLDVNFENKKYRFLINFIMTTGFYETFVKDSVMFEDEGDFYLNAGFIGFDTSQSQIATIINSKIFNLKI